MAAGNRFLGFGFGFGLLGDAATVEDSVHGLTNRKTAILLTELTLQVHFQNGKEKKKTSGTKENKA